MLISDYSYKEKLLFEPNCLLLSLFRLKDLTLGRDGNLQKHRLSQHAFKMYIHVWFNVVNYRLSLAHTETVIVSILAKLNH